MAASNKARTIVIRVSTGLAVALLVGVCALGGYLAGGSADATTTDAAHAREEARLAASKHTDLTARRAAYARGKRQGEKQGRARGHKLGERRGKRAAARQLHLAAAPTQVPAAQDSKTDGDTCPRGTIPRTQMGVDYCGPPPPIECPPGEAPVNASASCETLPKGIQEAGGGKRGECIPGFRFVDGRCLPK